MGLSEKRIAVLITLLLLVISFTIGLAMVIQYSYIPTMKNTVSNRCTIISCDVSSYSCSREDCTGSSSNQHCTTEYETCWRASVSFFLILHNRTYYGDTDFDFETYGGADTKCNSLEVQTSATCYYDKRKDPSSTLTLSKYGTAAGSIAGIVIFVFCLVGILVVLPIVAFRGV